MSFLDQMMAERKLLIDERNKYVNKPFFLLRKKLIAKVEEIDVELDDLDKMIYFYRKLEQEGNFDWRFFLV